MRTSMSTPNSLPSPCRAAQHSITLVITLGIAAFFSLFASGAVLAVEETRATTLRIEAEDSGTAYENSTCTSNAMEVSNDNFVGNGEAAGWSSFDTSAIPDGSTIVSVVFFFEPYLSDGTGPHVDFNGLSSDPASQSCSTRFQDILNGPTFFPNGWVIGTGPRSVDLGSNGAADLASHLSQDWFAVGMDHLYQDDHYFVAEGYQDNNEPYIEVTYTPPVQNKPDLELQAITVLPTPPLDDGNDVEIRVTFENIGDATASGRFMLRAWINGTLVEDTAFYDYAPGENRTQAIWIDPLSAGQYIVSATIDADDEQDESDEGNNSRNFVFDVEIPPADIRIEPTELNIGPGPGTPIFIELDYMELGGHSHRPSPGVIDRINQTFAANGYSIQIVVDDAIEHESVINIVSGGVATSPDVQSIMGQYFDHVDDPRYYYSLWVHNYSYNGESTTSTGIADRGGRVHIVSLGASVPNFDHEVGTFIHEFGHNLGQRHGGQNGGNYKPNYLSVMNYYYQLDGIGPGLVDREFAATAPDLDDFGYSYGLADPLNENDLDETVGLGFGIAVDWDCDNDSSETSVVRDIGGETYPPDFNFDRCALSGPRGVLNDFDNWGDIASRLNRSLPEKAGADEPMELCISLEEHQIQHDRIESLRERGVLPRKTLGPKDSLRGAETIETGFRIYNDGGELLTIQGIELDQSTSWLDWSPVAPFDIDPGNSVEVIVTTQLDQAPPGTTQRRLLVTSNDADESPYPDAVMLNIERAICDSLDLSHSGMGSDPEASPIKSVGCFTDHDYVPGEVITLTATPDSGFEVSVWSGTDDDGSTATTNQVTMPANPHAVSVTYVPSCFTLTTEHSGQGTDPLASPPNSAGCAPDTYVAGEIIDLSANPDPGWGVGGWSGTDDDASTATTNQVTMPANPHTVSVTYVPSCFTLTTEHSGQGGDPLASPPNSAGCAPDTYVAGETIDLSANPDPGWGVGGWIGTNDDGSTATTNQVTMPANAHTVSVTYVPSCFALATEHSGQGTDPLASPPNSAGCAPNTYIAGEIVGLKATPDTGWRVSAWNGTDDDASTATTNQVTMLAESTTVGVEYTQDGENLLLNGSCEDSGIPGDPTAPWYCHEGCALSSVTDPVIHLERACWASDLTGSWQGPAQLIEVSSLQNGAEYEVSVLVRGTMPGVSAQVVAFLQDSTGTQFVSFGPFQPIAANSWTPVGGTATLSWSGTLELARIYVQSSGTHGFYIDNARLYATSELPVHSLLVSLGGAGSGQVVSVPQGIECPDHCQHTFPAGSQLEIEAIPSPDSVFVGWTGACTGSGACVIELTANTGVSATFAEANSVDLLGNPGCELTVDPWVCHQGCSIELVNSPVAFGSGACRVFDLTATWQGPAQAIPPELIQPAEVLCGRVWVRGSTPFEGELMLFVSDSNGGVEHLSFSGPNPVLSGSFSLLEGQTAVHWTGDLQQLRLYVQGSSDSFVIDGAFLGACPFVEDDAYETEVGDTLVVPAPGVLENDGGSGGTVAELLRLPSHGSVTFFPDGSFEYSAAPGFSGQDTFSYRAHSTTTSSIPATVTIRVGAEEIFSDGFESGDTSRWSCAGDC